MTIKCEVIYPQSLTNEEITLATLELKQVPRVGEYLWFSEKKSGHSSWVIVDVCHWVGSGKIAYHNIALYAEPTMGFRYRLKKRGD